MSSLRNAVQRRNHKERAQPLERSKWGLLEKHKDYALRARDHNEKRKRLKILREKAADRNPDEFHFGMMRSKTVDGKRVGDRGNKALSLETAKLLKTQDAGYLRTMLQVTRKEREKLEQGVFVDEGEGSELRVLKDEEGKRGKHTVFVRSRNEQREFDPKEWFGTDDMGLQRTFNRPRKSEVDAQLENDVAATVEQHAKSKRELAAEHEIWKEQRKERKKRARNQEGKQNLLDAVKQRESALTAADQELELQRAKMSNSVGGVNKNGVKFKIRERKR
jgi:U3 small nucleolar RNA-associated protein 11